MYLVMGVAVFIFIPRAQTCAVRIHEVLLIQPELSDDISGTEKSISNSDNNIKVAFHDVTFRYANAEEPVLYNINFTVEKGKTTAIIGSTGSGKSTIANLIMRFYDIESGSILVYGKYLREYSQDELRNDFIENSEFGFEHSVSQGGSNFSGGQKQRLSIARTIIKKPEIYIFDDSFSALDFKTDAQLRAALKQETNDSGVIIVAQRISTILDADQIIVLDEGRIVGKGTHKELLDNCLIYQQIANSQLSEEELV